MDHLQAQVGNMFAGVWSHFGGEDTKVLHVQLNFQPTADINMTSSHLGMPRAASMCYWYKYLVRP